MQNTQPTGLSSGLAIDFPEASTLSSTVSISGSGTHDSTLSVECPTGNFAKLEQEVGAAFQRDVEYNENTGVHSESLPDGHPTRGATMHDSPDQTALELKQILGNAHSRLKNGAELLGSFLEPHIARPISLEQAKSRSRVTLDIFLHNNVCVQGGHLQGYVQICVRKNLKKYQPVFISGGQIWLIGFESLDADGERSIFYQCSSPLADVTLDAQRIYSSEPDEEGFSCAVEGTHSLPFVLPIASGSESGTAKGVLPLQSGLSIRYIAVVCLGIKDPVSGTKSIAHFYRDCDVWPRLNPSIVLAPTTRPIQVTASESLKLGGDGQITLTASLHRLHWVSGQSCFVNVKVGNHSEKALKNMCIQLVRSTTVFRTGYEFNSSRDGSKGTAIADTLQSSTTKRQVAQSILEVCARGTRGHASAKGWWAGVIPGQTRTFSHHLAIPPDALSISRGKFIEVSYTLHVILNVGTILPTEVKVSLPIEIVNFISFDPPHTPVISNPEGVGLHVGPSSASHLGSPMVSEYTKQEPYDDEEEVDSSDENENTGAERTAEVQLPPANIADAASPPRFADLYYTSLRENLDKAEHEQGVAAYLSEPRDSNDIVKTTVAERVKKNYLQKQALLASPNSDREIGSAACVTSPTLDKPLSGDSAMSSDSGYRSVSSHEAQRAAHAQLDCEDTEQTDPSGSDHAQSQSPSLKPPQERSPISGVGLPDDHIPYPHWKTPGSSRPDYVSQSSSSKSLTKIPRDSSKDVGGTVIKPEDHNHQSKAVNLAVNPPQSDEPVSPSAPRVGTVKDKIRELEQLAAKTAGVN